MRNSSRRSFLQTFSVGAVAALLAACSPAPQPQAANTTAPTSPPTPPAAGPTTAAPKQVTAPTVAPPQAVGADLLAKAKQEGTVNWYTGINDPASLKMAEAFTKRTGIAVEPLLLGGEQQLTRVLQEQEVGLNVVDVVATGNAGHFVIYKEKGMVEPYRTAEFDQILPGYADKDGYYYSQYSSRYIMAYNNKLVGAGEAPKSWQDLTEPKWKGKLVTANPAFSIGAGVVPYLQAKVYGWDFVEKIAKNEPLVLQSINDLYPTLAAGERVVGTTVVYTDLVGHIQKGLPLEPVFPAEGVPASKSAVGIMKKAPHPNAAKVLLDFLLSQEALQIMADVTGRDAVRRDVKAPAGVIPLASQKLIPVDYEDYAQRLDEVKQKFAQYFGA